MISLSVTDVLFVITIRFGIAVIAAFFIKKRIDKKEEKEIIDLSLKYAQTEKERLIKRTEEYKASHLDWNKIPDLSNLNYIYAIVPIIYKGSKKPLMKYCYFDSIKVKGVIIRARYRERKQAGLFYYTINEHEINIPVGSFNERWFIADELAIIKVIELIERGEKINVQAFYCSTSNENINKYLKRDID